MVLGPSNKSKGVDPGWDAQLRRVHGRGMNDMSTQYKLPSDSRELWRLDLQHRIWCLMMKGLYPREISERVQRLLSSHNEDGTPRNTIPAVLDIGSGSGVWVFEMAREFPEVKFVGVDLIDVPSRSTSIPSNCSFVKGDVTKGFEHFRNQFDFVHCRTVAGNVADPVAFMRRIASFLRPGGLLVLSDVTQILDEEKRPLPPAIDSKSDLDLDDPHEIIQTGKSWFVRWRAEFRNFGLGKNKDPKLRDDIALVEKSGVFKEVGWRDYTSPVNWEGDGDSGKGGQGEGIGELAALNLSELVNSTRPALLEGGIPREVVDRWLRNVQAEIHGPLIKMYSGWRAVWGFVASDAGSSESARREGTRL